MEKINKFSENIKNSKQKFKSFEDIINLPDNELKKHLRKFDNNIIFAAIQDANENLMDKILSNISKRSLTQYEQYIESLNKKFSLRRVKIARQLIYNLFLER